MNDEIPYSNAEYYDGFSAPPWDDVAFYRDRLAVPAPRLLELGCGSGRVLLPLAEHVGFAYGIDLCPDMLSICDRKLAQAGLDKHQVKTACADITDFDLTADHAKFDLITAPFRVMQNLETDAQVDGLMRCIKKHLVPGGEAILNTFSPRGGLDELKAFWSPRDGQTPCWTKPDGDHTVTMSDDCRVFRDDPLAVYPKLIYRRYNKHNELIDESIMEIVMRVWQPDELLDLIERHGLKVTQRLGGYEGEPWGQGPELVVAFGH